MAINRKESYYVVARFKNHFTALQFDDLLKAKNILFELTDALLDENTSTVKVSDSSGKDFEFKANDLTAVELILDPSLLIERGYNKH